MRITLVISTLRRGGAERVASILASAWAAQGKQITILTFDHGESPAYELHPGVQLRHLGILDVSTTVFQGLKRNTARARILRRALRESNPDVVISFLDMTNVLTVLATRCLDFPVIVVEQTDPALYDIGHIWSFLRRCVYRFANVLVCPTSRSSAKFQRMTGVRAVTIPNPIDVPDRFTVGVSSGKKCGEYELIGMGRLVPQKGFDLLLEAFSLIGGKHPDWKLTILGDGPLLGKLQEQAQALNLGERIHFAGSVPDPFPRLHAADLFVFSSRFEGFGMALAEAMACGLPAITFNCPEGPAEIVRDGIDGLLIPPEDVPALASALDRLMGDSTERGKLASRAPEVRSRFGREQILRLWQSLFDEMVGPGPKTTER
jgi:GalNAc-alpha-(1->4)-GalNAc-alpha-(1->3)-diNAcBac-PP-undecaprenol alpha-1,4-N-acetyl-D-galactosaminyltransferase